MVLMIVKVIKLVYDGINETKGRNEIYTVDSESKFTETSRKQSEFIVAVKEVSYAGSRNLGSFVAGL
jgi:hypothetical protein